MRRLYRVMWPHVFPEFTTLFIVDDSQGVNPGYWWRVAACT